MGLSTKARPVGSLLREMGFFCVNCFFPGLGPWYHKGETFDDMPRSIESIGESLSGADAAPFRRPGGRSTA